MKEIFKILGSLYLHKRPVMIFGNGVRLAGAEREAREFVNLLGIPYAVTWAVKDMFPETEPLLVGGFGTHGTRPANFAVQNADVIVSVGSRLDTKATGSPPGNFARGAKIFMVDLDKAEIDKFSRLGVSVEGLVMDAQTFLRGLISAAREQINLGAYWDVFPWQLRCSEWKTKYPPVVPEIIHRLSDEAKPGDIIVSDTGCALAWMMQGFKFKEGQRFLHAFNNTPMGYALPAAIAAHKATGKRVLVVTGDGAIMMSIAELATISGHKMPIRIVVLDNKGHAMCRQSQREWMGGAYPATSIEGGLTFPDFRKLAQAFGVDLEVVDIDPDQDVNPKVKFGKPNEDSYPYLSREEFKEQMIVQPVD